MLLFVLPYLIYKIYSLPRIQLIFFSLNFFQMTSSAEIICSALVLLLAIRTGYACRISEFSCRGSTLCLPLDKYCDGKDDCGDASDEPKHCTGKKCICYFTENTKHQQTKLRKGKPKLLIKLYNKDIKISHLSFNPPVIKGNVCSLLDFSQEQKKVNTHPSTQQSV